MVRLLLCTLLATVLLQAQLSQGTWKTDLSKKSIDLAELRSGGLPKDGIPAIDNPKFVEIRAASEWLNPKEPVLAVNLSGESRAYPLQILIWHELVNDQIGEIPILVSYCPLYNSAILFDRRIERKVYDFGVSGMLRHSDMVMYDRQTDSFWQQLTGEAIVGSMTGRKLEILPSQVVAFEMFAKTSPAGKILSRDTGHNRAYGQNPYVGYEFGDRLRFPVPSRRPTKLRPMERLVTVEFGKTARGISIFNASRAPGCRGQDQGNEVRVIDKETGSVWNVLGVVNEGPLSGKRLTPIPHGTYFAFAWLVFRPDTQIVGEQLGTDGPPISEAASPSWIR